MTALETAEVIDIAADDFVTTTASLSHVYEGGDADPITTEVIRHALSSAAEQMKIALMRTAFSPAIYETIDFCCALYDNEVRLVAQAKANPMFLGTMGFCVSACVRAVGGAEQLEPGDILFSTYGFDTGTHPQDAAVVAPAFVGDQLIGYAAIKAHHMDIGAKDLYCTDTVDNFQEGVIFPGVKLVRRGELQKDIHRILLANSRLPVMLQGDLTAEIVAVETGIAGLVRVVERYGVETFRASLERMFDHGEATVRSFLEQIPDGRYVQHGAMDSNGVTDDMVPFEVAVEVEGSDVVIDFTNSPPQQGGPMNCPLPTTVSMARLGVYAIAGGAELINEGHLRPIAIRTRPGTVYHPLPPAPIFMYGWPGLQACDVILRALGDALPEVVPAGSGGDICGVIFAGDTPDGGLWINIGVGFVGQGALAGADGPSPMVHIAVSGIRNSPAEAMEAKSPMIVRRFELLEDSGGSGRFRGGVGHETEYEMRADSYCISTVERTKTPPWGVQGGGDAAPNIFRATFPDGAVRDYGKVTHLSLPAGTRVIIHAGGGGGYGPASERDPDAVREDLRQGYVSEAGARRDYPHAFEDRS